MTIFHKRRCLSAYLPASKSSASIEFLDSVGEETTKGTSERGSNVEDSHAALNLETTVPESEQEGRSRKKTRLEMKKSVCLY